MIRYNCFSFKNNTMRLLAESPFHHIT